MAIGNKKKAAGGVKKALSLRAKDMSQGLIDDFDATIVGAEFRVHVFKEGNPEALVLALELQPDEGDVHTEYLGLGKKALENYLPSKDGIEPVDVDGDIEDMRGNYVVSTTDKARLAGGTAFGVFMKSVEDLGIEVDDDISSLVGTYGHFNRIVQPEIKGRGIVVDTGEPKKEFKVLCITEVKKAKQAGSKAAPAKAKGKPATEPEGGDGDQLREALSEALIEALGKAKNGTLSLVKIANVAMGLSDDKAEKKALTALAADEDFLTSIDGASYDSDDEILTLD